MGSDLEKAAIRRLRLETLIPLLLWIAGLYLFAHVLLQWTTEEKVRTWLAGTAGVGLVCHAFLWFRLPRHRSADYSLPLSRLGVAVWIRMAQAWLLCGVAGFALIPFAHSNLEWLPGLMLLSATCLEIAGVLARCFQDRSTLLTETLRARYDDAALLLVSWVAVISLRLPLVFILTPIWRVAYTCGLWLSQRRGKAGGRAPEHPYLGWITGVTVGFVAVALLPVFSPAVLTAASAVLLFIFTMVYSQEILIIAGKISADRRWIPPKNVAYDFFLLLLRILTGLLMLVSPVFPVDSSNFPIFMLAFTAILGLLPRFGILGVMGYIGLHLSRSAPDTLYWISFVLAGFSFILGGGAIAIWVPEDKWIKGGHPE